MVSIYTAMVITQSPAHYLYFTYTPIIVDGIAVENRTKSLPDQMHSVINVSHYPESLQTKRKLRRQCEKLKTKQTLGHFKRIIDECITTRHDRNNHLYIQQHVHIKCIKL